MEVETHGVSSACYIEFSHGRFASSSNNTTMNKYVRMQLSPGKKKTQEMTIWRAMTRKSPGDTPGYAARQALGGSLRFETLGLESYLKVDPRAN